MAEHVIVPADLSQRLDLLVGEWVRNVWRCDDTAPGDEDWGPLGPMLPKPEVSEVRAAAKKFPIHTGLSGDAWHPRHFGHLSDASACNAG